MNILALDLGTKCGWASFADGKITSGVWNNKPSRFDSAAQKFVAFKNYVREKCFFDGIDLIVFEEVRAHRAVDAAHSYGGFLAILHLTALEEKIEYKGVPVGTIKKFATGSGNAGKPEMIKAAVNLFPKINVIDDNHADALCILHYQLTYH